jgi:predicted TIM-barrel fold metal-dependent hydrolase
VRETESRSQPLAGPDPLIDVHAHFYFPGCGRAEWRQLNEARLRAGERIGITYHVGSILGTWGASSPVYFQSLQDTVVGNDAMLAIQAAVPDRIRCYVAVNPNDAAAALAEVQRCHAAGAVGIKLAAARRAGDSLLDPLMEFAAAHHLPVLHHAWQHRLRDVPGQDVSDALDLAALAERHPQVAIIVAHIGGGGDYRHTFAVARHVPNLYLDLSGSGVDRGMLDAALEAVGPERLLWGADLTLETGLAKLWALNELGLSAHELSLVRWKNAQRIFPPASFALPEGSTS